jgi:hypothetical protein
MELMLISFRSLNLTLNHLLEIAWWDELEEEGVKLKPFYGGGNPVRSPAAGAAKSVNGCIELSLMYKAAPYYILGKYIGAIGQAWSVDVGLVLYHMGLGDKPEEAGAMLYRLIMSCWGHGIALDDDTDTAKAFEKACQILNINYAGDKRLASPVRLDDSEFKSELVMPFLEYPEQED